jgi:hypothetical protein
LIRSAPQATIISSVVSTCSLAGTKGISLCRTVNIRIPKSVGFSKLSLRVIKETDGKVEEIYKIETVNPLEDKEKALASIDDGSEDSTVAAFTFPIKWTPLEFTNPGFVKVRGYLDDKHEIKAGSLKVNFPANNEQ